MKIRQKLTLGFLTIAMLVTFVGLISVYTSQKVLQKRIEEESVTRAMDILEHVDRSIYSRIEKLQAYVQDLLQEQILLMSNQEFDKLDNIQEYIDKIVRGWIADNTGQVDISMKNLINNELATEIIEELGLKSFYKGWCAKQLL